MPQVVICIMRCKLYTISKDSRCLDKITGVSPVISQTANIKPDTDIDILYPRFDFHYDSRILACNYLYCDTFDRYYYIKNIAVNTAQRIILDCEIDVLQTYSTDIKNSVATILRAEKIGKPTKYIDSKLPVYPSKKNITSIVMAQRSAPLSTTLSTADGDNYLLCVVGGAPTV